MMYSMYMNAGLLSLVYPFSIFGYALLEESRPKKGYWDWVRVYTSWILFLKFLFNLSAFGAVLQDESFQFYAGLLKIGLKNLDDLALLFRYMLPEILILILIMLNQI